MEGFLDGLGTFFVADDSEEFFAEPEGPESGVLVFGDVNRLFVVTSHWLLIVFIREVLVK